MTMLYQNPSYNKVCYKGTALYCYYSSSEPKNTRVTVILLSHAVNSQIFARILFSRMALKDVFATLKILD